MAQLLGVFARSLVGVKASGDLILRHGELIVWYLIFPSMYLGMLDPDHFRWKIVENLGFIV